jgi:hypothetical protein
MTDWGSGGTLAVEVDLGPESQYHSVFVCPVSREQASRDNPPMMLQVSLQIEFVLYLFR